jgi:integrase/recombinase XerD
MATATVQKSLRKPPARTVYGKGLSNARKAWNTEVKTTTDFKTVLSLFLRRCDKEGFTVTTKLNYTSQFQTFFNFMEERTHEFYQQVTHNDVVDYVTALQESDYADATKNLKLRALKTLFRWIATDADMKAMGCVPHLTALPKIRKVKGRLWIPSPQELMSFINRFDKDVVWGFRDYVIACLILDTGARIGEICNMTLDFIHRDTHMVTLKGKTGPRTVPIDPQFTLPLLERWLKIRERYAKGEGEQRVFVTRYGNRLTSNAMVHEFEKHRKRTGIGTHEEGCITPHVLRHYFCTYYLVNGGSLHMLQRITGHTELDTLMIYVHLANQLGAVKDEHVKASPLKNLSNNAAQLDGKKKKRKMF